MSISMTKSDGVTVLTLTSDPQSPCPPLCQILKALCYNPVCCTVSQLLRGLQGKSQTVLGVLQILVGLLNIGLGVILFVSPVYSFPVSSTLCPVWLGVLFMVFGTMCILSEKYPSPCLVIINSILNLAGVAFAITGIVFYSIAMGNVYIWRNCERDSYWYYRATTPPSLAQEQRMQEECMWFRSLVLMLLRGIIGLLIVLSTLELCVTISAFVLGIKALRKRAKEGNKGSDDPEYYKPLIEDVSTN